MTNKAANQKYSAKHREAGLCVHCPLPAAPGRLQCEPHLEHQRQVARRLYAAKYRPARAQRRRWRLDLSCCIACGDPVYGERRLCAPCRKRNLAWQATYRERRRERFRSKGLCVDCGAPARPGCVRCETHLARNRASKERAAAAKRAARAVVVRRSDSIEVAAPVPMCPDCGQNPPMRDQAICWCCANPPAPKSEKPKHARTHVAEVA